MSSDAAGMDDDIRAMTAATNASSRESSGKALQRTLMRRLSHQTRRAVLTCHAMCRHMYGMGEPLTLLTWVAIWMRDWGLTDDDAGKILRAVTSPHECAKIRSADGLRARLGAMATVLINRRASEEEARRRRTS